MEEYTQNVADNPETKHIKSNPKSDVKEMAEKIESVDSD